MPFSGLGLYLGNYQLSIIFLVYILFIVKIVSDFNSITIDGKKLVTISIFLQIALISSVIRGFEFASFLPSLVITGLSLLPFILVLKETKSVTSLKVSTIIITILVCFEFIFNYLLPDAINALNTILERAGATNTYRGYTRIRAGFLEPSVMAIILSFYLIILLECNAKLKGSKIYIALIILMIFLTMSSSGFILLLVLALLNLKMKNITNFISHPVNSLVVLIFLIVATVLLKEPIMKVLEKITLIASVIELGIVTGSVGYRTFSLIVPFEYILSGTWIDFFWGTGFSNYEHYLKMRFEGIAFSGFSDGTIGSVFSAILLSTGVLGFLCFMILIFQISCISDGKLHYNFFACIAFSFLVFGDLSSFTIWTMILLTRLALLEILKAQKNDQH